MVSLNILLQTGYTNAGSDIGVVSERLGFNSCVFVKN